MPHKGFRHTLETKIKLSALAKQRKLKDETKIKISNALKGRPSGFAGHGHSEESKAKTTASLLEWYETHPGPTKGMRFSDETRHKMSLAHSGGNNANWKGGGTPERQSVYNSLDWAEAIKKVWARDSAQCQRCHRQKTKHFAAFHIHHRVSFSLTKVRKNIDNLVLLCRTCHVWVHSKRNAHKEFLGAFQTNLIGGAHDQNGA